MFHFTDSIHSETIFVFGVYFYLFDSNKAGRVGYEVARVDNRVGTLTEATALEPLIWCKEYPKVFEGTGLPTLYIFLSYLSVKLLGQILGAIVARSRRVRWSGVVAII
jgi:hypothetical protein